MELKKKIKKSIQKKAREEKKTQQKKQNKMTIDTNPKVSVVTTNINGQREN